jgi:hypothetical protein
MPPQRKPKSVDEAYPAVQVDVRESMGTAARARKVEFTQTPGLLVRIVLGYRPDGRRVVNVISGDKLPTKNPDGVAATFTAKEIMRFENAKHFWSASRQDCTLEPIILIKEVFPGAEIIAFNPPPEDDDQEKIDNLGALVDIEA